MKREGPARAAVLEDQAETEVVPRSRESAQAKRAPPYREAALDVREDPLPNERKGREEGDPVKDEAGDMAALGEVVTGRREEGAAAMAPPQSAKLEDKTVDPESSVVPPVTHKAPP